MIEEVTHLAGHCTNCGRTLPPDAPEGLCAACLLTAGTETLTTGAVRLKPDSTAGRLEPDSTSSDDLPTMSSASGQSAPADGGPRLADGQSFGTYRIGRLLGRGGMGEVYEAEHIDSGRRVALKVLRSRLQHAEDRARFLREGQLAASVSHPHTVYIFGSEEIFGMPVISMELLPGGTLKDRVVANGPLPPAQAVAAVLDIVGGLDAAQAAGILHRDIKPSNCFVDRDGTVKVGDFGLSVSTLARDVHHDLSTSGFEGTPQFAPPEQLRGEPLDVRADIYAVGATLYYLLTGKPPLDAPDLRQLFARVTTDVPASPRAIRPEIPPRLAAVVMECLAKSPSERPPSYAALADALRPFLPPADAPATPAIRFVAGVADVAIMAVPLTAWSLWAIDPVTGTAERSAVISLWSTLVTAVYYLVLESIWGASLGKRLVGLSVTSADGRAASFGRIAVRTAIYFVVANLPVAALFLIGLVRIETFNTVRGVIGLAMLALLFSTARRHNGWAAVHDLASGTRVVVRSRFHAKRVVPALETPIETAPARAAAAPRRYGPYTVVSEAGKTTEGELFVGFDPVLRRDVWIHALPPGAPPVSDGRRDVARVGRLHWLAGRRSDRENWDAFEAPDGGPLSIATANVSWPAVKLWMMDLAHELAAAERDRSLPVLRMDRLWLRNDGHLVLLDFPAPARRSGTGDDAAQRDLTPIDLLSALGARALSELDRRHGPAAVPLSARALVARLAGPEPSGLPQRLGGVAPGLPQRLGGVAPGLPQRLGGVAPGLDEARAQIIAAAAAHDSVRRSRRALPIALASAPTLVVVLAAALMLPYMYRFMTNIETVEILSALSALGNPNPPAASRLRDPAIREAIERYLAGRYGRILGDDRFWGSLMMQAGFRNLRPIAAALLARHGDVAPVELARVSDVLAPERRRWEQQSRIQLRGLLNLGGVIVSTLAALAMALVLGASLISAALVPGGLLLRQLGHAVVSSDGREIGRGRSLVRAVVAWLPVIVWLGYLAASPKIRGFVPAPPAPWAGVGLTIAVMTAGISWTLLRPTRGPHDWLLRTWVCPR